jgi:tight adherence protein C
MTELFAHTLHVVTSPLGIGVVAALACLGAIVAAYRALFPAADPVIDRLRHPDADEPVAPGIAVTGGLALDGAQAEQSAAAAEIGRALVHAGYREARAIPTFVTAKVVLAVGTPLAFLVFAQSAGDVFEYPAATAVAVAILGFFAPNFWLYLKVRDRQTAIERGLPDAMDLLVTCVEAGLGLDAALSRVADEIELSAPVLSEELKLTFLEVQAGMPRPEAFRRLAGRTGVEDLRSLSATLAQTEMFGTSISAALRTRAEWMRTRRMQRAEERAAVVSVKMTVPLVLFILPSLIAIIMGPAVVHIVKNLMPSFGS